MYRMGFLLTIVTLPALLVCTTAKSANAQAFGVELHNTLMPVSGSMGGASLARPQDVQSALNGNPATIAGFQGTQFSFGGGWVEPTYNVSHDGGVLPGIGAFAAKSEAEGAALGNIVVLQDFRALGMPVTFGAGLIASSGLGVSFRDVPASNGTSAMINVLEITMGAGIEVTDNLKFGANVMLGSATLDGPFAGIGAAVYDYALRGSVGLTYDFGCFTTVSSYYQTPQNFNFDNAVSFAGGPFIDIDVDLPTNIGLGIANESLMNGRLLLAFDVLYKQYDNADLFAALWTDQWVYQFGAQFKLNRKVRLRAGYAYADNIIQSPPGGSAGGVTPPPPIQAGLEYVQAQFAAINRHRITVGMGMRNMLPGVDMDLFAGFMPRESQDFGAFTSANVESYWIGTGLTWRFGRGAVDRLPVPNDW
jgi:long-chain fatty acid transport protein